jgi:predicted RNA-binding protein with RPS1 domain
MTTEPTSENTDPTATANTAPAPVSNTPAETSTPAASSSPENSAANTTGRPAATPAEASSVANPVAASESTAPSTQPKRPVSIGSQRDAADKSLAPSKPAAVQTAVANPIDLSGVEKAPAPPAPPEPEIISNAGFSDDVDAEIEAALGGLSMEDVVSGSVTAANDIEPNTRIKGVVTKIHNDNVFFKLNGQFEGVATLHHFKEMPAEGDLVEIIVRGLNIEDGLYELAVPGAAVGVADWDDIIEGSVIEARVTGSNTGGLEVMVNTIPGFIPASQIDRIRIEDFSEFVNQKFACVVMEVNPDKRKLVLSRRAILERENEEKRKQLLTELEAGQLRDGVITRLMDFGAFCDLGGVEGLIHVSKIAWSRVKHPSDVLTVGEKVRVKVEKLDVDANRISLSLRDTLENPWTTVSSNFNVNDIVKGTVTRIADFGAFVRLVPGVEGLVHISELAYQRIAKVSSVVSEDQEIEVKIISIDPDSQKIALSHKACLAPPTPKVSDRADAKNAEQPEEPPRELAVPARNEPLHGGTGRKSGGESVGLNW